MEYVPHCGANTQSVWRCGWSVLQRVSPLDAHLEADGGRQSLAGVGGLRVDELRELVAHVLVGHQKLPEAAQCRLVVQACIARVRGPSYYFVKDPAWGFNCMGSASDVLCMDTDIPLLGEGTRSRASSAELWFVPIWKCLLEGA